MPGPESFEQIRHCISRCRYSISRPRAMQKCLSIAVLCVQAKLQYLKYRISHASSLPQNWGDSEEFLECSGEYYDVSIGLRLLIFFSRKTWEYRPATAQAARGCVQRTLPDGYDFFRKQDTHRRANRKRRSAQACETNGIISLKKRKHYMSKSGGSRASSKRRP